MTKREYVFLVLMSALASCGYCGSGAVCKNPNAPPVAESGLSGAARAGDTVTVLMMAHASEVIVWSLAHAAIDAAPAGADVVYFAFVNYTTLGYGDVVPVERWRLIGPMTAMNGVLVFGWSTAVIFDVLRRTMTHDLAARR